jgi:hypothetical protein
VPGDSVGTHSLGDATLVVLGDAAAQNVGISVAGAGDIDGDGLDDVLLGVPSDQTAGTQAGAAFLVYGGTAGSIDVSEAGITMIGPAAFDQVGWGLGAGDVDGDGLRDLLVGGSNADGGDGAVYIVLGADL